MNSESSMSATATVKSLQSCPTLHDPIDGSPPGSPVPGTLQARTLAWVAIAFSNAWKWKVKVKLLSHVRLLATAWTAAHQAPLSMGFSRQEYWSGVPLRLINRICSCFSLYVYNNDIIQQGVMNSWSMKLQLWYWRNQYHTCLHVWLQKAMCLGSILNISGLILGSNCYLTKVPYWLRHPSAPQTPVQIRSVWLTGVVFSFFFF